MKLSKLEIKKIKDKTSNIAKYDNNALRSMISFIKKHEKEWNKEMGRLPDFQAMESASNLPDDILSMCDKFDEMYKKIEDIRKRFDKIEESMKVADNLMKDVDNLLKDVQ